jgi:opacity protein-like surface antigen
MKSILRIVSCLCLAMAMATSASAQDELNELLNESIDDGKLLISAYVSPFMNSVSLGMNQGWYNTAKTHKIAGIDLTITANAMTIPKSDLFFDVTKLDLDVVQLESNSRDYPMAPTVFGPDNQPLFSYTDKNTGIKETYLGPGGIDLEGNIGLNMVPVPMANLGVGLPKNTDVKLRFTPTIDLGDDSSLKIFGIGIMHDVKQWIPGIKLLPFDLSGFVGFTKFKMETYFDREDHPDQRGLFEMNATTVQGLISKQFSVLTLYGGLGYNLAKSNLAMKGTYDINDDGAVNPNEVDPLDLKFSASGFRTTAGFRLKLAVLTIHADYTLQKYKCLTVGLGVSVR